MKKKRLHSKQKDLSGIPPVPAKTNWGGGFLNAIRLERDTLRSVDEYPFSVPAVRHLERLEFHPAVTFFIGENGSGKSTLLEAIAVKFGYNAEGGGKNFDFITRETHSELHKSLILERSFDHATDGFFLR